MISVSFSGFSLSVKAIQLLRDAFTCPCPKNECDGERPPSMFASSPGIGSMLAGTGAGASNNDSSV